MDNVSSGSAALGPRNRAETAFDIARQHLSSAQSRLKPSSTLSGAGVGKRSVLTLFGRSSAAGKVSTGSTSAPTSPGSSPRLDRSHSHKLHHHDTSLYSPSASPSSSSSRTSSPGHRLRRAASARNRAPLALSSTSGSYKVAPLPSPPPFPIRDGMFPSCSKVQVKLDMPEMTRPSMSRRMSSSMTVSASTLQATQTSSPSPEGKQGRAYYSDSEGEDLVDVYLRSSPSQSYMTTYFTLPIHQQAQISSEPWGESEDLELVLDGMAEYTPATQSASDRRASAQSTSSTISTTSEGLDESTLLSFPVPPERPPFKSVPEYQSWHQEQGPEQEQQQEQQYSIPSLRGPPPTSPPLQPLPPSPSSRSSSSPVLHISASSSTCPVLPPLSHEVSSFAESNQQQQQQRGSYQYQYQEEGISPLTTTTKMTGWQPATPPMSPPLYLDFTSAWDSQRKQQQQQQQHQHARAIDGERRPSASANARERARARRARALSSDLEDEDSESASEWLREEDEMEMDDESDASASASGLGSARRTKRVPRCDHRFGWASGSENEHEQESGTESLSGRSESSGYDPRWSSESSHSMRELLRALGV